MRQVLFDKKGKVFIEDVPAPSCGPDEIVVRNEFSLISAGTERSMISLMKKPLVQMAIERTDLTRQVIKFARESGIRKTVDLVKSRIDIWHLLGYSCAGRVVRAGERIQHVGANDMVACCGSGVANHAEFVTANRNMFVKVIPGVKYEDAAFAGVGAIAMQSIRQLEPELGETHVVMGMGLIGQLVAQLLKANGCRVIGIDPDVGKTDKPYVDLGLSGSKVQDVMQYTSGNGADGVIICAASRSELVNEAFDLCRRKARVVLLGVTGMALDRSRMYEKELEFRISTAFGPGSYDNGYAEHGVDYPIGYVRWTMNRNMQAFLELVEKGSISLSGLVEATYPVNEAEKAYQEILGGKRSCVLIRYSAKALETIEKVTVQRHIGKAGTKLGLIGIGNFAKGFLIPAIREEKVMHIQAVCALDGTNAKKVAGEIGASYATTDYMQILKDKKIDAVIISTRHDSHAQIAIDAVRAGKHIFVEKPAAINETEFDRLESVLKSHKKTYAVGFNRRYSPAILKMKSMLKMGSPVMMDYIFNNSMLPADHWVNRRDVGGGRFIGEACHIIDLFNFITEAEPVSLSAQKITTAKGDLDDNNVSAIVKYSDGSVCSLTYCCIGNSGSDRERAVVFQDGMVLEMDNFTQLRQDGKRVWTGSADLGYGQEMHELAEKLAGKASRLITKRESLLATQMAFSIIRIIKGG
jgi:predicted dehydrogenase/threonine dehydrogenase-like Zn-dependent dehydrogenase